MNLEELRAEHARERIGPLWLDAVKSVCQNVVRQYPPQVYSSAPTWRDGLEDLVQDVVANALIRDAQVEYILDVAVTIDDVRRLLRRHVRHVLARGRRRTVVDQLLDRSVRLLDRGPFHVVAEHPERAWARDGDPEPRSAFREAVVIVRSAGRVPQHGIERAPTLFTTGTLSGILDSIAEIHSPLTRQELGKIFDFGLTPFLPGVLVSKDRPEAGRSFLAPEDELQVAESVGNIVDALDIQQLQLLRSKLLGRSDADVAADLGVSRPTAAARKREMLAVVESAFGDLRPELKDVAMDRLSIRLTLPRLQHGEALDADDDGPATDGDER